MRVRVGVRVRVRVRVSCGEGHREVGLHLGPVRDVVVLVRDGGLGRRLVRGEG